MSAANTRLLDVWLPRFDVRSRTARCIPVPAATVWQALTTMSVDEMTATRLLMGLRSLPAALSGYRPPAAPVGGGWDELLTRIGAVPLGVRQEREAVVGLAGQFWRPSGGLVRLESAQAFHDLADPSIARVAVSFELSPAPGGTMLATETRVLVPDPASRRAFLRYWRLIGLGSHIIRRDWLRAVAVTATRLTPSAP